MYPPLSLMEGDYMSVAIFSLHMAGLSSLLSSINFITTVLCMRDKGMTLDRIPLFT
jgi:heme/copper-type cytochrome/quinol oxidase subunit 1